MENRNRSQMFGLNLFACIAAVALAIALVAYGYFQFRAKQHEAEQARAAVEIMRDAMKASGDYWQNMEKMNKELEQSIRRSQSPAPTSSPSGEPPARLPEYKTP